MGWCRGPKSLCIVTELCASSLDQLLYKRQAPALPAGRALTIALDAANGLAFLHAATPPVIHRECELPLWFFLIGHRTVSELYYQLTFFCG